MHTCARSRHHPCHHFLVIIVDGVIAGGSGVTIDGEQKNKMICFTFRVYLRLRSDFVVVGYCLLSMRFFLSLCRLFSPLVWAYFGLLQ